jgi:hypothetical protein
MKTFRYAEEAVDFLLNNVRMGTYDKRFMANLLMTKIVPQNSVTSNQVSLFKKVVQKYHKQLLALQINSIEMSELPWGLTVVPSSSEFTDASIKIEDDNIILYTPYKESFVKEFKSLRLMTWSFEFKHYTTSFSLNKLRYILETVAKHYDKVNCCNTIKDILKEIEIYESITCWNPTLVKINGNMYIAAINEPLYNATIDIDLYNQQELLIDYGIMIDENM